MRWTERTSVPDIDNLLVARPPPTTSTPVIPGQAATARWRLPARFVFALLAAGVGVLGLLPNPDAVPLSGWDKLDHAGGFAALMAIALPARLGRTWRVALALVAYGGAIELLQMQVPGRSAEWGDLLADAIGVGLGWAVGSAVLRWLDRHLTRAASSS